MKKVLGIDVGSVSINVVGIDSDYQLVFNEYIRTSGQPLEAVKKD